MYNIVYCTMNSIYHKLFLYHFTLNIYKLNIITIILYIIKQGTELIIPSLATNFLHFRCSVAGRIYFSPSFLYFFCSIFMVRAILFLGTSTLITCTSTTSPTLTASNGCLINFSVIWEI